MERGCRPRLLQLPNISDVTKACNQFMCLHPIERQLCAVCFPAFEIILTSNYPFDASRILAHLIQFHGWVLTYGC